MIMRLFTIVALGVLNSACTTAHSARTYADIEAAIARMEANWYRSLLSNRPQETRITRDLRFRLFFELPLEERAVVVMDSFANADLDGELASTMGFMLRYRTQPRSLPFTPDPGYTAALFRIIESFPESQVRRFCDDDPEQYARLRRNLERWKKYCNLSS